MSKTIMLIHGAWLNAHSWEGLKARYAEAKLTAALFKNQKQAPSNTELKINPDRAHWTCIQPGWEIDQVPLGSLGSHISKGATSPLVSSSAMASKIGCE